jgi:hypothetical protein
MFAAVWMNGLWNWYVLVAEVSASGICFLSKDEVNLMLLYVKSIFYLTQEREIESTSIVANE